MAAPVAPVHLHTITTVIWSSAAPVCKGSPHRLKCLAAQQRAPPGRTAHLPAWLAPPCLMLWSFGLLLQSDEHRFRQDAQLHLAAEFQSRATNKRELLRAEQCGAPPLHTATT